MPESQTDIRRQGEIRLFYGLFKLTNGGFGFEVMSKTAMDDFAKEYSKAFVLRLVRGEPITNQWL